MIDPITMMVASIGMQFFNNYANSKKNTEIQKKQREFQKAAAEHDFERMRKLQAESAKLALELEAEVHKERVEDINIIRKTKRFSIPERAVQYLKTKRTAGIPPIRP